MDITVKLPAIGTFYQIDGIPGHASNIWEIQRVTVVLGESNNKDIPTQTWMIVAVDDDGNDLGEDPEYINPDMYDYKEM